MLWIIVFMFIIDTIVFIGEIGTYRANYMAHSSDGFESFYPSHSVCIISLMASITFFIIIVVAIIIYLLKTKKFRGR